MASPMRLRPGYGDKEEVKRYATEHKILQMIDSLVDELLKSKPPNPKAHLAAFLNETPMSESKTSFTDAILNKELGSVWESCGKDVEKFSIKLKQALPDELKKYWKGMSPVGFTKPTKTPTHRVGDVTIVSTDVVSKFDATDDAEHAVEPLMKSVKLVTADYRPPRDIFQVVSDLSTWHFPSKKLWPSCLIDRVKKNCRFMGQRHNYGEPLEIAIPLYLYSITIFRDVIWSVWIDTEDCGKWSLIDGLSIDLEGYYNQNASVLPQVILMKLAKLINSIVREMHEMRRPSDTQESEEGRTQLKWEPTSDMNIVLENGGLVSGKERLSSWKGLTLFEEKITKPEISVYLCRYERKNEHLDERLSATNPLADTVAWLPPPWCILGKPKKPKKRVSQASRPNTPQINKPQISFNRLPPPGVLEYLSSRRCIEVVAMNEDTDYYFHSKPLFEKDSGCKVAELIKRCFQQHNQKEYSKDIHNSLQQLLNDDNPKIKLVKELVIAKLGPESEDTPNPLQIAHSLDINTITWEGRTLYAALSGSCFYITNGEAEPCQLFRVDHPHEQQPYYHLNATMRCLQEGKEATTFELDEASAQKHNIDDKVFVARRNEVLGAGLECLSRVAKAPTLQTHLSELLDRKWQCSLDSGNRSVHYHFGEEYEHVKRTDQYFDNTTHRDVGWYLHNNLTAPPGSTFCDHLKKLRPDNCPDNTMVTGKFTTGAWLYQQVKPLLYYVDQAMTNVSRTIVSTGWECAPPKGAEIKGYRGMKQVKLNRKVYDRGNVVVWSSFSSTSSDQGIAHSYAAGGNASVFIIQGTACRLIAPWSRFGREEEWLYPLNTMFQVQSLLTEEQKKILGKNDFQLFEISEVDEAGAELIQVRRCLAKAETKEAAGIVFAACTALKNGNGVLDLALNDQNDGAVKPKWIYTVTVNFDPQNQCPVLTSNTTKVCCSNAAVTLQGKAGSTTGKKLLNKRDSVFFDGTNDDGKKVLELVSRLLEVSDHKGPDIVELKKLSDIVQICAKKPSAKWELTLEVRKDRGHKGFAVKNDGARILYNILCKNVKLHRIDLRNNQIDKEGAALLLLGLRANSHVVQLTITDNTGKPHPPKDVNRVEKKMHKILTSVEAVRQTCLAAATFAVISASILPPKCVSNEERRPSLSRTYSHSFSEASTPSGISREPRHPANLDFYRTQQVINMRCLHHKGTINADLLQLDFGRNWSYYAAHAFWDLEVLNINFGNLFDTQKDEAVCFIRRLAERCTLMSNSSITRKPKYPKMPGALVAACRVTDCKTIDILLRMGCNPGETDEYGETPQLKLERRLGSLKDKDEMTTRLHMCLKNLAPNHPQWGNVEWQLKNFALEMVRICEEKPVQDLADELCQNLKFTSQIDNEPKGTSILNALRKHLKTFECKAKQCGHLSKTPVGRMNTTLLCLKLFSSNGQGTDRALGQHASDSSRSTDRKQNPFDAKPQWIHKHRLPYKKICDLWEAFTKEELVPRKCPHGLYLFEYEYAEYQKKANEKRKWDECSTKRESESEENTGMSKKKRTGRRMVTWNEVRKDMLAESTDAVWEDGYMSWTEFVTRLWANCKDEPAQVRKLNKQKFYVFEHDWTKEDGEWRDAVEEEPQPLNVTIRSELLEPSQNLYNPCVFGGKAVLEENRQLLYKWAKTWAVLNCTLSFCEEREWKLYRTVLNVPHLVIFEHMKLCKGQVFGLPETSLWEVERRTFETTNADGSICKVRRTYEEAFSEHKSEKPWSKALRKWTEKDHKGDLLKKHEFTRRFVGSENGDEAWDMADPEDPFHTDNEVDFAKCNTIRFIARGKFRGASITAFDSSEQYQRNDVALPALETFIVEDVNMIGSVLTIRLIARGSMLNNDPELAAWCSSINESLIPVSEERFSEEGMRKPYKQTGSELPSSTSHSSAVFSKTPVGENATLYFSAACESFSAGQRAKLVSDITEILKPVNQFCFHANSSGKKFMWNHAWAQPPSEIGRPLPITYRPSYTFLSKLGRKQRDPSNQLDITSHIPSVKLSGDLMQMQSSTVIEISAKTINEVHHRENNNLDLDGMYTNLVKEVPLPNEVYGDKVFKITVGELQQLARSTMVTTSASLPTTFYEHLVGRFTSHPDYMHFFTVFRTSPLIDIVDRWEICYEMHLQLAEKELEETRSKLVQADAQLKENNREGYGLKYRNEVKDAIINRNLRLLRKGKTAMENQYQAPFSLWVFEVLNDPTAYGFTSKEHARLNFNKTLMELSTEVCVSQRGHFFVSGNAKDKSNHIAEKPARAVTFLSAPGLDFCYVQPTLKEATKYFHRIARVDNKGKPISSHEGWAYFKEGKRKEFCHRVKVLYRCVFTSAKKQSVRNMCVLNLGLGVFLENIEPILKPEIVTEYFRAQFELLSEEDWGFENYFINAVQYTELANILLDEGLHPGRDYNNEKDGLHLRCNIVFHDKDVKFLAAHLAEHGMSASFLNPSDSQAVMQGCMGMYWELGRSFNYVGEEDWGATSTGVLSCFSICGQQLNLKSENFNDEMEISYDTTHDEVLSE